VNVRLATPGVNVALFAIAGVVAAGRVAGRSHFFSDVVAGTAVGVVAGAVIARAVPRAQ
jgi:membrane-associated phospholipid phosphatase